MPHSSPRAGAGLAGRRRAACILCFVLACSGDVVPDASRVPTPIPASVASPSGGAAASIPLMTPDASVASIDASVDMSDRVTFHQVYTEVILSGGCDTSFCHGSGVGNLFFSDEAQAYRDLLGSEAQPGAEASSCGRAGHKRVVPFDPDASLLYTKLLAMQPCGQPMPPPPVELLDPSKVELVRRWITSGAAQGDVGQDVPGGATAPRDAGASAVGGPHPQRPPTTSDWSFFGYDAANSRNARSETHLTPDNATALRVLWSKTDITGGMNSTPAVVAGVLYFADYARNLHALQARTGAPLWKTALKTGQVTGSPLVTDDRIYVAGGATLEALERSTGRSLWNVRLDAHGNTVVWSSPVLAESLVLIGVASTELVLNKTDYTFAGSVVGIDRTSGAIRWRVYTAGSTVKASDGRTPAGDGASVWSSAAVDTSRKLAFIGTGQAYETPASGLSDSLLAIHYETGKLVWSHQYTRDDVFVTAKRCDSGGACPNDYDIGASPNLFVANGRDAVGVGSKAGLYRALDRESGELIWSRNLTTGSSGGGIMTTAAVGDGVLYVNSNQWVDYQFPTRGGHSVKDTSRTYALDADTGETIWERPMRAPGIGHLTLANGVVYQGLVDGHGIALAATDGRILWQYDLGHDLACGFSVVDGVLYGGSGGSWLAPSTRPGGSLFAFTAD